MSKFAEKNSLHYQEYNIILVPLHITELSYETRGSLINYHYRILQESLELHV